MDSRRFSVDQKIHKFGRFPDMVLEGQIHDTYEEAYKEYKDYVATAAGRENWEFVESGGKEPNFYSIYRYYDPVLQDKIEIEYRILTLISV